MWALIVDGKVRETTNINPVGRFHPSFVWVKTSKDVSQGWDYDGENFTPPPQPEPPAFEDLQAQAIARLCVKFQEAASAVTAGYPEIERLTWPVQQAEISAWFLDNSTPTPYLDGLAAERGIDEQEMRIKTWEQTELFMAASKMLVGKLQKLRDRVYEAKSVYDLDAITWDEVQDES